MSDIHDETYGHIVVKRSLKSKNIRLTVLTSGTLQVSAPIYTPLRFIKLFIKGSRTEIDHLMLHTLVTYADGAIIGKSHKLTVARGATTRVEYKKPHILVVLSDGDSMKDIAVQQMIKPYVATALRKEAKAYLPRRLEFLAGKFGYEYNKVRFSHAKSRWGSCSSDKTISLNIALMKLDFTLIDYVLIHELVHTEEMNHSQAFWVRVSEADPFYKAHRKIIKNNIPHI